MYLNDMEDIMDKAGRGLSHKERALRRNTIAAEAESLNKTMPYGALLAFLASKYELSEPYIEQLLPKKYKLDSKNRLKESVVLRVSELISTVDHKEAISIVANDFNTTINFVTAACKAAKLRMPKLNLISKKEKEVMRLIESGYTINDIAEKMNNSRENIYRYYRNLTADGILKVTAMTKSGKRKSRLSRFIQDRTEDIIRMHNEGQKSKEIAIKLDVPINYIHNVLRSNNVFNTTSNSACLSNIRHKWLVILADLFNPSMTITKIALKYDKAPSHISLLIAECKKLGIPLPDRVDGRRKATLSEIDSKTISDTSDNLFI